MSIRTRIQATSITHPFSMNKKIDNYLSENMPDLMDEHKIADRNDIADLDDKFDGYEKRMDELDLWKKKFDVDLKSSEKRMQRLNLKYGIKGGE
ncbi:MAG: hypothetical protein U9R75_09845 [Candidatus Thermoplasmatota archaeon]|nr:hypothetical protein [Candidatus Thermoplasmatota archaeon]MEA3559542.1 hypothetical protein [Candidatus Thermoplasmatota archaeon]